MTSNVFDLDAYRGVRDLVRLARTVDLADDRAYDPVEDAELNDDGTDPYAEPADVTAAADAAGYRTWLHGVD
jgi:hypothetical protein